MLLQRLNTFFWVTLQLPIFADGDFPPESSVDMAKIMKRFEDLEEVSATERMDRARQYTIRATANSKLMISLTQGRSPQGV
jgi:hypothetical protein